MAKIKITWLKSSIGYAADQKRTVEALGLHRLHQSRLVEDSPSLRGMLAKVKHLVKVEEAKERPSRRRRQTSEAK